MLGSVLNRFNVSYASLLHHTMVGLMICLALELCCHVNFMLELGSVLLCPGKEA
jgi:hypothetical protein